MSIDPQSASAALPLAGLRVVEFSHMVMGPTCGLVLADLGAEVIKIEPVPEGDNTRRLVGAGAGFFIMFNRNKRSLAIDSKSDAGRAALLRLIDSADVVTENFRPGALDAQGFGYAALSQRNPRLVYCSLKGFLAGPYEDRTALDEVVQMMGGLAYMTGPPGRPLRAGSSVNDIMGGMFAAIAILAALRQRDATGLGQYVKSGLFENNIFLVAQHMAQFAVTGQAPAPMPNRISAWGIYDLFSVRDGEQVFVAVVSDSQWKIFCAAFDLPDLYADQSLASNSQRVMARARLIPRLAECFAGYGKAELVAKLEAHGLPFAPVTRPEELFDDPHLNHSGGLLPLTMPDGRETRLPALPMQFGSLADGDAAGHGRLPLRRSPPQVGEDSADLLVELGYSAEEIAAMVAAGNLRIA
ncbi:CaiB/BaiF CoA-transferase family protein [Ferrovibrio sp.]|uniref:CaiB/BaiF CoA transferase family protein n=1 Tax=Ferrovibrio sp. TaxID=1917215 RepID=UPI001B3DD964|nr:CaiB/BaiF CoA-transferase family protein [Ferrovibrio sp.]MBP7064468.1 CoA transferase [Ferrovibrio sp.]